MRADEMAPDGRERTSPATRAICPLCRDSFDEPARYRDHLGLSHGLFDDEGSETVLAQPDVDQAPETVDQAPETTGRQEPGTAPAAQPQHGSDGAEAASERTAAIMAVVAAGLAVLVTAAVVAPLVVVAGTILSGAGLVVWAWAHGAPADALPAYLAPPTSVNPPDATTAPLSSEEIASRRFSFSDPGYSVGEVRQFLDAVAAAFRNAEKVAPSGEIDGFAAVGQEVSGVLRAARDTAEQIRAKAELESREQRDRMERTRHELIECIRGAEGLLKTLRQGWCDARPAESPDPL